MGLEDVLMATERYGSFKGDKVSQAINYTETYDMVRSYLASTGRAESMPERPTPEYIGATAKEIRKETESNLVKTVSENYQDIMSKLDGEDLQKLALKYAAPKGVKSIEEALKKGDINSLKKMYSEEIAKDSILASGARYLQDSDIAEIMQRKLRIRASKFIQENLTTEKEEGKYEFDMKKAQKYVSETISNLDDKKKKEAYLDLGDLFYNMAARAAEEAKKKENK